MKLPLGVSTSLLVLVLAASIQAQPAPYKGYALPQENGGELFRRYSGLIEDRPVKIAGWSRKGYLAYFLPVPTGESGAGYFENFYIQNLVTDELVFKTGYTVNDWFDEKPTSIFAPGQGYQAVLDKYGIVVPRDNQWLPAKATIDGRAYQVEIRVNARGEGHYPDDTVTDYSVYVLSGGKEKRVGRFTVSPCMGIEFLGMLKNPYESRVAIVVGEIRHGWEGPPHSIDYKVIGCDLTKGL